MEDSLEASIELSVSLQAAARSGNIAGCSDLIARGALAWWQDENGWTALHFAAEGGHPELFKYLLRNGAVWNLVDNLGYTAGDIAYSLNDAAVFNLIVMEGVRSEMLKAVLEAASGNDDADDEADAHLNDGAEDSSTKANTADKIVPVDDNPTSLAKQEAEQTPVARTSSDPAKPSTASDNKAFLKSRLRFEVGSNGEERCVDEEGNGVMMGWELPIMQETARLLCEGRDRMEEADDVDRPAAEEAEEGDGVGTDGFSVLNVGFGLGLVDSELQKYKPKRHVIIEPHPDVLAHARRKGWYEKEGVQFFEGTWDQYMVALENGEVVAEFDAIYYDTFSEHYRDLHRFFDNLPNLLRDEESRFSFFHGLGATSMTFYQCYTHVSEMHLQEIGLKTEWHEVPMTDQGTVTWDGIVRRYWSIPCPYKLPLCKLDF